MKLNIYSYLVCGEGHVVHISKQIYIKTINIFVCNEYFSIIYLQQFLVNEIRGLLKKSLPLFFSAIILV
jgi:hypothetical protein